MTTPFTCPDCGSPIQLDTDAETETTIVRQPVGAMPYVETVRRHANVAFCTGCEWAIEVKP